MPSRFACVRLGYASMAPSFELRLHNVYYFYHREAHLLHIVLHILLHIAQKKMEQCFLRAKCGMQRSRAWCGTPPILGVVNMVGTRNFTCYMGAL